MIFSSRLYKRVEGQYTSSVLQFDKVFSQLVVIMQIAQFLPTLLDLCFKLFNIQSLFPHFEYFTLYLRRVSFIFYFFPVPIKWIIFYWLLYLSLLAKTLDFSSAL